MFIFSSSILLTPATLSGSYTSKTFINETQIQLYHSPASNHAVAYIPGSDLVSPSLSSLLLPLVLWALALRSLKPMKLFLSRGQCTMSFILWKCSFYSRPPWAFILSLHTAVISMSYPVTHTMYLTLISHLLCIKKYWVKSSSFSIVHYHPSPLYFSNRTKIKEALFMCAVSQGQE